MLPCHCSAKKSYCIDKSQRQKDAAWPVRGVNLHCRGNFCPSYNQVRLTGVAEIVTERPVLQEIWDANPLMRQFLGSLDNPQLLVYRIRPTRVRFMQEWALEYHEVPIS